MLSDVPSSTRCHINRVEEDIAIVDWKLCVTMSVVQVAVLYGFFSPVNGGISSRMKLLADV
jgi:hypothetical protein